MNLYKQFIEKQTAIIDLINDQQKLEMELTNIKKEIFKKHIKRFNKKPIGKTVIKDDGFEIIYSRSEKVNLLTEVIKQDDFKSDCIVEKTTPEKKSLSFSKTEYKKLSDDEQEKLEKYLAREMGKPTLNVKLKEEK